MPATTLLPSQVCTLEHMPLRQHKRLLLGISSCVLGLLAPGPSLWVPLAGIVLAPPWLPPRGLGSVVRVGLRCLGLVFLEPTSVFRESRVLCASPAAFGSLRGRWGMMCLPFFGSSRGDSHFLRRRDQLRATEPGFPSCGIVACTQDAACLGLL